MAACEVCGNEYEATFEVHTHAGGSVHTFDSFECAIHALAPTCARCGCRVLGHGLSAEEKVFCGAHCARGAGVGELRDRG
jgi:hypothetical protein